MGQLMIINTGNDGIRNQDGHIVWVHVSTCFSLPVSQHPPLLSHPSLNPTIAVCHPTWFATGSGYCSAPAPACYLVHMVVTFLTINRPAFWCRLWSLLGLVQVLQLTLRAKFWDIDKLGTDLATCWLSGVRTPVRSLRRPGNEDRQLLLPWQCTCPNACSFWMSASFTGCVGLSHSTLLDQSTPLYSLPTSQGHGEDQ